MGVGARALTFSPSMLYISAFDIRPSSACPRNLSVASDEIWTERKEFLMRLSVSTPGEAEIRFDSDSALRSARIEDHILAIPGVIDMRIGLDSPRATTASIHEVTVWTGRLFSMNVIAAKVAKILAERSSSVPFTEVIVICGDRNSLQLAQAIQAAQRLEGGDKKDEFAIGEGLPQ